MFTGQLLSRSFSGSRLPRFIATFAALALIPECLPGQEAEITGPKEQSNGYVTVCILPNAMVPDVVKAEAVARATSMFTRIGVKISWRRGRPVRDRGNAIAIELTENTPAALMPGALAYAFPFEGVHIRVFYDRVRLLCDGGDLLAHVLVHEITHILEGIDRHSETGIMKSRWSADDFSAMRFGSLGFAAADVVLIHSGIAARQRTKGHGWANDPVTLGRVRPERIGVLPRTP